MKWVSLDGGAQPDLAGKTLILPSCGSANVDQMTIDLLCLNFCQQVGRLISDNVDFVASQNPFDPNSKVLASSIDVYTGNLPTIGPVVVLRVAASLPAAKRQILDYAREICEFAETSGVKQLILVRSVGSVFCVDTQLQDWPHTVRGFGFVCGPLKVKPMEPYNEPDQDMLKASVFGELFECIKRNTKLDFGAMFVFVHGEMVFDEALLLAKTMSGAEKLDLPYTWKAV